MALGIRTQPPDCAEILFAFADRRFEYDCIGCGAQCCRGHGYRLTGGAELERHIATHSQVRLFLKRASRLERETFEVTNFQPSCFMLTADNRCRVQQAWGFDSKPETCRLFPFNHLRSIGRYVIVTPHRTLCPLTVSENGSDKSSHLELRTLIEAPEFSQQPIPVGCVIADVDTAVRLERAIVGLSEARLNAGSMEEFVLAQTEMTREIAGDYCQPANERFGTADHLREFCDQLRLALGTWPDPSDDTDRQVVRTAIATTPMVRSYLAFPRLVKNSAALSLPIERIPYLGLVLQKLLALARGAGMRAINLQTINGLFSRYSEFLGLSPWLDSRMVLTRASGIDLDMTPADDRRSFLGYVKLIRGLLPATQGVPLGGLLAESCDSDQVGRLDQLQRLAGRIAGRVEVRSGQNRRRANVRGAARRWLIRHAPDELLCKHAERKRSRNRDANLHVARPA